MIPTLLCDLIVAFIVGIATKAERDEGWPDGLLQMAASAVGNAVIV